MDNLSEKEKRLEDILKDLGSVMVAYSAGVDSTYLLAKAKEVLGGSCIAVTAKADSFSKREFAEADAFCRENDIEHVIIDWDEFSVDGFDKNPKNRCYICKKALFGRFLDAAKEKCVSCLIEGSNTDDSGDYRPGMAAISELGIKSPLKEAGLSKQDIRDLSKMMGLSTWDKPSYACLSTRFPYGETITKEKLSMVEKAEQRLFDTGFKQARVRVHGNLARIEVPFRDMERIMQEDIREGISSYLYSLGFSYVSLDMEGYRTGSMNRDLDI